ncbi:MAG: hypothetical protein K2X47_11240, partial [Bdellovibrionales bacterium]|nr:hypothetical protein [Bdellovibrionales bacterium]
YSAWLRAWGSRIGRTVYWTPRVEVMDRSLLEVGSGVVIGHMVIFCAHVISPSKGRLVLFVRRIRIADGSFVGASVRLGPGAFVDGSEPVKSHTLLYWKGEFK